MTTRRSCAPGGRTAWRRTGSAGEDEGVDDEGGVGADDHRVEVERPRAGRRARPRADRARRPRRRARRRRPAAIRGSRRAAGATRSPATISRAVSRSTGGSATARSATSSTRIPPAATTTSGPSSGSRTIPSATSTPVDLALHEHARSEPLREVVVRRAHGVAVGQPEAYAVRLGLVVDRLLGGLEHHRVARRLGRRDRLVPRRHDGPRDRDPVVREQRRPVGGPTSRPSGRDAPRRRPPAAAAAWRGRQQVAERAQSRHRPLEHRDPQRPQPGGGGLVDGRRQVRQDGDRLVGARQQPLQRLRERLVPVVLLDQVDRQRHGPHLGVVRERRERSRRRGPRCRRRCPTRRAGWSAPAPGRAARSAARSSPARGRRTVRRAARPRRRPALARPPSRARSPGHAQQTGAAAGRSRTARDCRSARRGRRSGARRTPRTAPPSRRPSRRWRRSGRRPAPARAPTSRRSARPPGCRARRPRPARPGARRRRASSRARARPRASRAATSA